MFTTFKKYEPIGSPNYDGKAPLYILSADGRFPDCVSPGSQLEEGDHFLAMFPCYKSQTHDYYHHSQGNGGQMRKRDWLASIFTPIHQWLQGYIPPAQGKKSSLRGQREEIGELVGGGISVTQAHDDSGSGSGNPDFTGWPILSVTEDDDEDYYFTGKDNKRKRKRKRNLSSKENENVNKNEPNTNNNGNTKKEDFCKENRWLGDVNKIIRHGASCKSLTRQKEHHASH